MRFGKSLCAFVTLALACVALAGCAGRESREEKKPAVPSREKVAATKPAAATRATDPAAKTRFWFTYAFNPPGKRDWVRVGDGKWEERWQTGEVIAYVEGKRYSHDDIKGIIVQRADGTLDVLIPDGGKGAMVLFRNPKAENPDAWSPLGAIEGFE